MSNVVLPVLKLHVNIAVSFSMVKMPIETPVGIMEHPVTNVEMLGRCFQLQCLVGDTAYQYYAMDMESGEFVILDLES